MKVNDIIIPSIQSIINKVFLKGSKNDNNSGFIIKLLPKPRKLSEDYKIFNIKYLKLILKKQQRSLTIKLKSTSKK